MADDILYLFPLAPGEVQHGRSLTEHVYDRGGNLVWSRGTVLENQLLIDRAGLQGLYRLATEEERHEERVRKIPLRNDNFGGPVEYQSARSWFFAVRTRLRSALELIDQGKPHGIGLIRGVSRQIIDANRRNRDATLATIQLEQSGSYRITHALHNAIVTVSISTLREQKPAELSALICASLTHDIAMPDQDQLHREDRPLSDEEWTQIKGHPKESARMLRELGVVEPAWLETVEQHHERADGSGYPAGLNRGAIRASARVLGIADAWCAMFMGKAYRKPAEIHHAMRELKAGADPDAADLLTRALGLYPPGAVVKLSNDETAIVLKRGEHPLRPILMAVLRRNNTPYSRPALVDLEKNQLEIKALTRYDPWRLAAVSIDHLWRLPVSDTKI